MLSPPRWGGHTIMITVGEITIANAITIAIIWDSRRDCYSIIRLQLLMQLSKRAETENDILKSKEFTVVQFKKSQHAIVNI